MTSRYVLPNESAERVTRRESIDHALESCRERLREQLLKDVSASALRAPIREFAMLASRHAIPPERVLAMIKSVLNGVPSFERRNAAERMDLTAQFAQIAIHAYYAVDDGNRAD
jgi:hypothetical protein